MEKRYSKGFTILGSYTWLKDLSDVASSSVGVSASPGNSFFPQDVHNLAANRGNAVGDRPQQLVVSGVWDIPLFKDHSKWEGRLLGGWQVSGTYTAALGSWLTPAFLRYQLRGQQAELSVRPEPSQVAANDYGILQSKLPCKSRARSIGQCRNRDDSGQRHQPVEFGIHEEVPGQGKTLSAISRRIFQPFQSPAVR